MLDSESSTLLHRIPKPGLLDLDMWTLHHNLTSNYFAGQDMEELFLDFLPLTQFR